ncbi:hypothetical protein MOF05_21605 [Bacillus haynesii]|uniref:hypothetical protein n=1 Tax=Bacillus haynesii TaxID=1925021 RepID=UPI00227EE819|nr:hypothetical protein [Bacillus haynesii]MCY9290948.1 hypothetical protein [Bacillus haynesii]
MDKRKQCEKSRKRSLRFIKSGKWFKEFAHAEQNSDLKVMTLLRFNWGLDESAKQWANYRLSVAKGGCQEIEAARRLKELVDKRRESRKENTR